MTPGERSVATAPFSGSNPFLPLPRTVPQFGSHSLNTPRHLRNYFSDRRRRHGRGVSHERHTSYRDFAVKVLPASFAVDAERRARFEREAQAVAASHPDMLSIYDIGTHEGQWYVVTELLEGESLRDRLRAGAL